MLGEDVPVRAKVPRIDSFSAHADARELEDWWRTMPALPPTTFVTHGELDPADAMRQWIGRHLQWNVRVPKQGECVEQ